MRAIEMNALDSLSFVTCVMQMFTQMLYKPAKKERKRQETAAARQQRQTLEQCSLAQKLMMIQTDSCIKASRLAMHYKQG